MKIQKLSTQLIGQLDKAPADRSLPIIIKFRSDEKSVRGLTADFPLQTLFRLVPAASMQASRQSIDRLSEDPRIEQVWWDSPVHACLDLSVPLIGAPTLWRSDLDGSGIVVAVVDTGVDVGHPDLRGRVALTHDFSGEGYFDFNGHGTHVAGIIAGRGAKFRGVAPGATVIAAKVLRSDGSGSMSSVMQGVEWAVERNVDIINLSLGSAGASDGTDPLSQTCDAAVSRGVIVCVAAGNEGPGRGTVGSPGAARQVITIGASTDQDQVADFSSRGPTADDRVKPDLAFPGYGITSLRAKDTSMGNVIDDLYTEASGTSMATPHASGAAALLLQLKPSLAPAQIKLALKNTAKNLNLPPNTQGGGRADLIAAHRLASMLTPEPGLPPPGPVPGGAVGCLAAPLRSIGLIRTG